MPKSSSKNTDKQTNKTSKMILFCLLLFRKITLSRLKDKSAALFLYCFQKKYQNEIGFISSETNPRLIYIKSGTDRYGNTSYK